MTSPAVKSPRMTTGFKYKAFISYSHSDRRWADWLHRGLEKYSVPTRLIGVETEKGQIPNRLKPIFKDREELASSANLGEAINRALSQSENLIVVCSPRAAQSDYVNAEIKHFHEVGQPRNVFCMIVDGSPNARETRNECFPPALRLGLVDDSHVEHIASDVRPLGDGKKGAFLKIVAGLLGVGFDDLRQRDLQRRHRRMVGITAASVAGFVTAVGLAITAIFARIEADRQRDVAEAAQVTSKRTTQFMTEIFEVVDPGIALGRDVTAKEVLARGRSRIDALDSEPVIQGNLLHTLGIVHIGIGEYVTASELLEAALELRNNADPETRLETEIALGNAFFLEGNLTQSAAHFERAVAYVESQPATTWKALSSSALNGLAEVIAEQGDPIGAEVRHREALQRDRSMSSDPTAGLARSLQGVGLTLLYQGRFTEAEPYLVESLETYRAVQGEDHPKVSEGHNALSVLYYSMDDMDRAIVHLEAAAEVTRRVLGEQHPSYASVLNNLGRLVLETGDTKKARIFLEQSVVVDRSHGRHRHSDLVFSLNSLALTDMADHRYETAMALWREALALAEEHSHRLRGMILVHLASIDCQSGDMVEGRERLRRALQVLDEEYSEENWRHAVAASVKGECTARAGQLDAGIRLSKNALERIETSKGADNLFTRLAYERLQRIHELGS